MFSWAFRLFIIAVLLMIPLARSRAPSGFMPDAVLRGISYPNPPQEMSHEEMCLLLRQTFTPIGWGTQAVALLGEDQQTILKLFLNRGLRGLRRVGLSSFQSWLHQNPQKRAREIQEEALPCYARAFADLREETGILYLRFDPEADKVPPIRVVCLDGKEREVSLDGAPFLIQKKMETVAERMKAVRNDPIRLDQTIRAIHDLLDRRARKGYSDIRRGFAIGKNFGFIGDRAYVLDAGRVVYSDEQRDHPEGEIAFQEGNLARWKAQFGEPNDR